MSDATNTVTAGTTVTKKVAEKVIEKVADTGLVPTVVETAEFSLDVPTKAVVSLKLVLGVAAGAAVGAAGFYGYQKFREYRAKKAATALLVDIDTVDAPIK